MTINRMMTNICSSDLQTSKAFYLNLFDFEADYDSEWFVHLISRARQLELGIIQENHELVPEGYQGTPAGLYFTLVVDDVDRIHLLAKEQGVNIVQPPELTFYGQKRMLIEDPSGVLVDVSSPANA